MSNRSKETLGLAVAGSRAYHSGLSLHLMHVSDVLSGLAYGKIGMFMEAAFSNCKSRFFFTLQRKEKIEKEVVFFHTKKKKIKEQRSQTVFCRKATKQFQTCEAHFMLMTSIIL